MRRVALLITEGDTDRTSLQNPLRQLLKDRGLFKKVECQVYGTDFLLHSYRKKDCPKIESAEEVTDRIKSCIRRYLDSNSDGIKAEDIAGVAVLCDLDACFCNDACVVHKNDGGVEYDVSSCQIRCQNIPYIIERNSTKRDAFGILVSDQVIQIPGRRKAVPLGVFYVNINLEHALHSDASALSNAEKDELAKDFRSRFQTDSEGFAALLESIHTIGASYDESHNESQLKNHAFDRESNLITIIDWVSKLLWAPVRSGNSHHSLMVRNWNQLVGGEIKEPPILIVSFLYNLADSSVLTIRR